MENATRALTMAAGVLIALMVIGLIYTLVGQLSETSRQEDLILKAEQTAEFNREYEAYDKKLMRGTDVITVINKAISNNEKYDNQDKIYDINVQFILKSPVIQVEVKVVDGVPSKNSTQRTDFEEETVYELIDYSEKDRINDDIRQFMKLGALSSDSDDGIYISYEDARNYTKVYDNFKVFKRKLFKCTKLSYSKETGRVNLLVFEELKQSNELDGYN